MPRAANAVSVSPDDYGIELEKIFEAAYKQAAATVASLRGTQVGLDNAKSRAGEYARTRGSELITDIDDTTREKTQDIIDKGISEDLSDAEVSDRLEGLYGETRADLIARTETSFAYNTGTVRALADMGEDYVYVSDPCECGEDVCDVDGEIWTVDEAEANPIGHPNCGRDFRPLTEDELAEVKAEEEDPEEEGVGGFSVRDLAERLFDLEAFVRQRFEFDEDAHPRDETGKFVHVGDASSLGGATAKSFYKDEKGALHLFKPDPKTKILAAVAASKIAQLVGHTMAIPAFQTTVDGKVGIMQKMLEGATKLGPITALSKGDVAQIQREHVVDWITSQHDAHPGQFVRDKDENIRGVDKSQAWKYFPADKLDTSYHPNAAYGEKPPLYNTLFGPAWNGMGKVDPEAVRPMMERIKKVKYEDVEKILRGYADYTHKGDKAHADAFIKAAYHRIRSAPRDFAKFYSTMLGKPVKFAALTHEMFEFDEDKHPRGPDGKFVEAGGEQDISQGLPMAGSKADYEQYVKDNPIDEDAALDEQPISGDYAEAGNLQGVDPEQAILDAEAAQAEAAADAQHDEDVGQVQITKESIDPLKSMTALEKKLAEQKAKQKENWKKWGKAYRERKKQKELEAKQAAMGIKPTPAGKIETLEHLNSFLGTLQMETKVGSEYYKALDRVKAAAASKPEYAQNWIKLAAENPKGSFALAVAGAAGGYHSTKSSLEQMAKADTGYVLKPTSQSAHAPQGVGLAVAGLYGITPDEYAAGRSAMSNYIDGDYHQMNGALRAHPDAPLTGKNLAMDRMMSKLPDVQGQNTIYRAFRCDSDPKLKALLKSGTGQYRDPAFMSTTSSKSFAEGWKGVGGKNSNEVFIMSWKNEGGAKNCTPFAGGTGEGEMIYRPGSTVEILSSKWVSQGYGDSGRWYVEARVIGVGKTIEAKHSAAQAPHVATSPVAPKPEPNKYFYNKKVSPNTGKAYYIKTVSPEWKAWKAGGGKAEAPKPAPVSNEPKVLGQTKAEYVKGGGTPAVFDHLAKVESGIIAPHYMTPVPEKVTPAKQTKDYHYEKKTSPSGKTYWKKVKGAKA